MIGAKGRQLLGTACPEEVGPTFASFSHMAFSFLAYLTAVHALCYNVTGNPYVLAMQVLLNEDRKPIHRPCGGGCKRRGVLDAAHVHCPARSGQKAVWFLGNN